jgi:ABC-type oligopeptide transport system ATPase subunit
MIELEERVLLEVKGLKKYFPITKGLFKKTVGYVKAVDGISLNIKCGETLGLVGESGCGKSTLGRSIIRLIEPLEGQVIMDGVDILSLNKDGEITNYISRSIRITKSKNDGRRYS